MDTLGLLINVMMPVVLIVALGWFAGTKLDFRRFDPVASVILGSWSTFCDRRVRRRRTRSVDRHRLNRWRARSDVLRSWVGLSCGTSAWRHTIANKSSRHHKLLWQRRQCRAGDLRLRIRRRGYPLCSGADGGNKRNRHLHGVALASAQESGLASAIKRSLLTPMTIASILAIILNISGLNFPLVFDRAISVTAGALIPVMLVTLGLQMAGNLRPEVGADIGIAMITKLIAILLGAAVFGRFLGLEGDDLGGPHETRPTRQNSLPSGSSITMTLKPSSS